MKGVKSWKEHKHHQRIAEEKKFRSKKEKKEYRDSKRDYENYPSTNIGDK